MQPDPSDIQEAFTTNLQTTTNQVDGAAGFQARFAHQMDGRPSGSSEVRVSPYHSTVEWQTFFPQRDAKEFVPGAGIGTLAHIDVLRDMYFHVLGRERARDLFVQSSTPITPERLRHLNAMGLRSTTLLGMPFPEYLRRSMEYGQTKGFTFPREELEQLEEDERRVRGVMTRIRSAAHGVLNGLLNTHDAVLVRTKARPQRQDLSGTPSSAG